MEKLYDKSLTELHDLLVSKEITAVDLTEETLNRIQDTEEQLGSFITVSEEKAMALAKAIDLKGITESNPLAGILIAFKAKALSLTFRVNGPIWSKLEAKAIKPKRDTRP